LLTLSTCIASPSRQALIQKIPFANLFFLGTMTDMLAVIQNLKKPFADNLPPCHPRCSHLSFFSRKEIKVFDENIPRFSETLIWTLNRLVPNEVHLYGENLGMFSSKTLISFQRKKERHGHLR